MGGDARPFRIPLIIIFYHIMKLTFEKIQEAEKNWEIKDRVYRLKVGSPLSWTIQTKHTRKKPLLYFDEELGYNREIRYATNQDLYWLTIKTDTSH